MRHNTMLKSCLLGAALLGGLAMVSGAMAQECSCTTAASSAPTGGVVTPLSGNVTVSTTGGVVRIAAQSHLPVNSQFSTASASTASYSIGSCSGTVGAQFGVTVSQIGNMICVRQEDQSLPPSTGDGGVGITAAALGGAAAIGGGLVLFSVGQEDLSR